MSFARPQRELDTQKSAQHGDGIVAPQSSVTRNNVLGHAHDPTGDAGIAGIFKFPSSPDFLSCRWPEGIGIVLVVATEFFFVTVVMLAGVKCIIGVVIFHIGFKSPVMSFFQTASRNLLDAEVAATVRHHVALSVVGADRLPDSGYLRAKVAQENLIKGSSIPFSIIRATQFYEFVAKIADLSTDGNKVRLPSTLIQPMAADDVASGVCRVALGSPLNGTVEIGGPEKFRLNEWVQRGLAARKDPRDVVADPQARYYGIKVNETTLIPGGEARIGDTHFEDWLNAAAGQISTANSAAAAASKGPNNPQQ